MPAVPWWAVFSAATLPVLLAFGWTAGAVRQPPGYDPISDTISNLSSYGTVNRQILVGCLAGLGVAHLVTAIGLRPVRTAARLVYGLGGVATIVVATVPKIDSQTPRAHGIAAVVAFVALAAWPAVATLPVPSRHGRRAGPGDRGRPWVLRPAVGGTASSVMLALGLWLAVQVPDGAWTGLAERAAAGAEALWPLVVAVTLYRRGNRATRRSA